MWITLGIFFFRWTEFASIFPRLRECRFSNDRRELLSSARPDNKSLLEPTQAAMLGCMRSYRPTYAAAYPRRLITKTKASHTVLRYGRLPSFNSFGQKIRCCFHCPYKHHKHCAACGMHGSAPIYQTLPRAKLAFVP